MEQKYFYDFILRINSIARIGLTFSTDPYAISNYNLIKDESTAMLNDFQNVNLDRNGYFVRNIYPTPNISVRTVIFNQAGEVLLVKEAKDGGYSLPGGWCDIYESPTQAAIKECKQEAGADVAITRLVGVMHRTPFLSPVSVPEYTLVLEGKLLGPLQDHEYETTDVGFFALDHLPSFSRKVSTPEVLRMIMAAQNDEILLD